MTATLLVCLLRRLPGRVLAYRLVHEQHVALGAPRDRLVDRAGEQSVEEAVLAAADDEQVGVALLGHLEQTLGRIAQFDHVLGLDLVTRQRQLRPLKLPSRQLLRLRRRRRRLRQRHRPARGNRTGDGRRGEFRRLLQRRNGRQAAHAHHDESGGEGLGDLARAPERPLRRVRPVVADDDRLHRRLPALAAPLLLVLLHHSAGGDLLLTPSVAALLLGFLLDVLVLALLFFADAA